MKLDKMHPVEPVLCYKLQPLSFKPFGTKEPNKILRLIKHKRKFSNPVKQSNSKGIILFSNGMCYTVTMMSHIHTCPLV
jgi:hypothetical protein